MHLILIVYGTKTVCTRNILLCPGLYLHWICSLEFLTFYKRNRFQARIDVDNTEIADKECFILFDFFESRFVYFCRYIRSFWGLHMQNQKFVNICIVLWRGDFTVSQGPPCRTVVYLLIYKCTCSKYF